MKNLILQIVIMPLPWFLRRKVLCRLLHYEIDEDAHIGRSIILADILIMESNSKLGSLTICRNIDKLHMKKNSSIGSLNFFTGFNSKKTNEYTHRVDRKCELVLGEHSIITSRHYLDCNGGIYIGNFTTIGGIRSTLLTHSIDVYESRQDVKPINIGDYCFTGTGCVILAGSVLPNFCVLGGGAVLSKVYLDSHYLYAGVPANPVKKLDSMDVKFFERKVGFVK